MLEKYLMEYLNNFGENFPVFLFMGMPDKDIIKVIKDCLDKDELYIPEEIGDGVHF